jgi:hypothetical protein
MNTQGVSRIKKVLIPEIPCSVLVDLVFLYANLSDYFTGIAQLVERRSPKP